MEKDEKESPPESKAAERPGDLGSVIELLSMAARAAGVLISLAALFVLFGHAIVFSFMQRTKIYGLASFSQEYYTDATLKFVRDAYEILGSQASYALVMLAFMGLIGYGLLTASLLPAMTRKTLTFLLRPFHREKPAALLSQVMGMGLIALVVIATLNIEGITSWLYGLNSVVSYLITPLNPKESSELILFMISLPALAIVLFYLVLNFNEFKKKPFNYYYAILISSFILFVAIPVGYGKGVYDIDVFRVSALDYATPPDLLLLKGLKSDIEEGGRTVYYLGMISDKLVLLDHRDLDGPVKILLIDKDQIKSINVSSTLSDVKVSSVKALLDYANRSYLEKQDTVIPLGKGISKESVDVDQFFGGKP